MDIKEQYEELTKQLKEIVPFRAFPTRELVKELRKKEHKITLQTELIIKDVYNSGDITGILCLTEKQDDKALACALTHVIVSDRNPLYKEIMDYQKKRFKRIQS
jgi:hypothetical protein